MKMLALRVLWRALRGRWDAWAAARAPILHYIHRVLRPVAVVSTFAFATSLLLLPRPASA
jgi:hypothetical protein